MRISRRRLYVGSGVEDVIDSNLHTRLDKYGQYHVDYTQAQNDDIVKVVYNSDVSRNEDDIMKGAFRGVNAFSYDEILGHYLDLYVGHVNGGRFRENGSSGGLVTWIAVKLLESKKIDGFIHVKKSNKPGMLFEYGISRTTKEIESGAKSRYYPVELSDVLNTVKNEPGKYAVIGISEIITELRLLAENDKIINERVIFYFGLVAGHQKTTKYAEAIAWEYGIKPGDLKDINFRAKRSVGRATEYDTSFTGKVNGKDRTFIVRGTEPFVSSWAHGFFKARFSDFTDNTFNEAADITFGDAWLKEYVEDSLGNNILIVRNTDIAEIIKKGISDKEVSLDTVDTNTIIRSQKGLVHHTKDEIAYRLYKENKRYGWAPRKRIKPSSELENHRKKVQDARQQIAELSHVYYKRAVDRDDFEYFFKKMRVYIDKYDKLYGTMGAHHPKKVRADGAILTLPGYYNYGNVIQRYALQKFLSNNGLNFVSYIHSKVNNQGSIYKHPKEVYVKAPARLVKRFLRRQKPYWYFPDLSDYHKEIKREINLVNFVNKHINVKLFDSNDRYDTYIVGSDQVWRKWRNDSEMLAYYFLSFLKGRRVNRIAYAASFGKDKIDEVMSVEDVEYVRPYIEQFDSISVREKSATNIIMDTWGIDGVANVLDPTLLLDRSEYSRLIDKSDSKDQKIAPIFVYVLDETPAVKLFIEEIKTAKGKDIMKIGAHGNTESDTLPSVEVWLKGFRDAELVVTNSFHGMLFSIINHTDFIVIERKDGGLSRIEDFMKDFGIHGRLIGEDELDVFKLEQVQPLDWDRIGKTLSERREYSADWLLRAIRKNKL